MGRRLVGAAAAVLTTAVAAQTFGLAPASADPSAKDWTTLRACESGGNYQIVSRSGHYFGAYQFDQSTWNSVGGTGRPDKASPAEQDYRALKLYRMRGWQPWTCASIEGLHNDKDARSGRTPTYAEAATVAGHSLRGSGSSSPSGSGSSGSSSGSSGSSGSGSSGSAGSSTTAPAWKGTTFAYGDCDPAIKTFQLQMNKRGYHYTFQGTGCYVDMTRGAVRAVQVANDLPRTGTIDKATWTAAWSGKAPR